MTQYDPGLFEPTDSGVQLATDLNGLVDSLRTNHKGPARPSYVRPGTLWIDDAGAAWLLKLFDGEQDITIAGFDPATHALTTAGVPTSRKVRTGTAFLLNGVAGTDAAPAEADLTADLLFKLIFASTAATIEGTREDLPVHPAGLKAAMDEAVGTLGIIATEAVPLSGQTSILFSGIPNTARRLTLQFAGLSNTVETSNYVRLGVAGALVTTGYVSGAAYMGSGVGGGGGASGDGTGFMATIGFPAAEKVYGNVMLTRLGSTNTWTSSHVLSRNGDARVMAGGGVVTLSGPAERLAMTVASGAFDAGSAALLVE